MTVSDKIVFDCPKCRQGINAPTNAAGEMAACPNCGKDVKVPGSVSKNNVVKQPLPLQPPITTTPASQSGTKQQIKNKSKGMAIAGLTLGIISIVPVFFCGGPIWAVLGIIFSSVTLNRVSKKPDQYEGEGLAIAGLITSIVGLMFNLVVLFLFGFMGASMAAFLNSINNLMK